MNDQTTEPQTEETAAPSEDETPKSSGNGWFWMLFVLMVVAGSAAVTWPVWSPMAPPWVRTVVADLQGKEVATDPAFETAPIVTHETPAVPVVEAPVEAAPVVAAPTTVVDAVVGPVIMAPDNTARLDALEARINAVAAGGNRDASDLAAKFSANLSTELAATNARINALEAQIADLVARPAGSPNANAQAMILAVTQVQAALDREKPYANALGALKAIATQDADVASALVTLVPYAEDGLPSLNTLTADFDALGTQAIRAKGRDSAEASTLGERFMDGVKGLVTVRRTDGTTGDPIDDAIAHATTALNAGDLEAAVSALSTLSGGPKATVADWARLAQARVDADVAMERLHAHALAVLAGAN